MGQEVRKGLSEAGQEVRKSKTKYPICYKHIAIELFGGQYYKPAGPLDYTNLSINSSIDVTTVFESFIPFINYDILITYIYKIIYIDFE